MLVTVRVFNLEVYLVLMPLILQNRSFVRVGHLTSLIDNWFEFLLSADTYLYGAIHIVTWQIHVVPTSHIAVRLFFEKAISIHFRRFTRSPFVNFFKTSFSPSLFSLFTTSSKHNYHHPAGRCWKDGPQSAAERNDNLHVMGGGEET